MTPNTQTSSGLSNSKPAPVDRMKQLAATLLSERGEASGAQVARELHYVLRALDADDRHSFQRYLATEFQPDKAALRAAAERYLADGTPEAAAALAQATDPPRQELLRRMNMAPGGTGALIAMRSEVNARLRGEPELKLLDADLQQSVRLMVQPRLSRTAAYRLANAGRGAGKADRLRSRARDQGLGRSAATACARPALLRLLPSRASGRAAHFRRSRSGGRTGHVHAALVVTGYGGGHGAGAGPARRHRDLLFDLQLSGRPCAACRSATS